MNPTGESVNTQPTVAAKLQDSLRRLAVFTVILSLVTLAIATAGILFALSQNSKTNDLAHNTKDLATTTTGALCSYKADLQQRIQQGEDFLKENPKGVPGISPELVQTNIDNQKRTLTTLQVLDCPPATGLDG